MPEPRRFATMRRGSTAAICRIDEPDRVYLTVGNLAVRDLRSASDEDLLKLTPRQPRAFDEFYVRHESVVLSYFAGGLPRRMSLST